MKRLKFYGPGFANLANAIKQYDRFFEAGVEMALARNPTNHKWYVVDPRGG